MAINIQAFRALRRNVLVGLILCLVSTGSRSLGVEMTIPVQFSGGHDIGKHDYGRPVTLIAAALGVTPELFREAFSGVTPARGRGPTRDEAHKNKAALLKVLAPQGVTNERLDKVSDYYRYQPQSGRLWTTKSAKAHAIIVEGRIDRIVITEPGSGYCSLPKVSVEGFENQTFEVTLGYSKDLQKNGAIIAIEMSKTLPTARTPLK